MAKYTPSAAKAAKGVSLVQSVVTSANCIFHKLDQSNDLGIDALIEMVRDGEPLNRQIAVQIKTGASYWSQEPGICKFDIGSHRAYWEKHPLPVFGIVIADDLKSAAYINIKNFLKEHPKTSVVQFQRNQINSFDSQTFADIFIPLLVGETPKIPLRRAVDLFWSTDISEINVGLRVMFRRFPNDEDIWVQFTDCLIKRDVDTIPRMMIYYLAHIPWHGDIMGFGEMPNETTSAFARSQFRKLGRPEMLKLLNLIDENGIERGSIGQSVDAFATEFPDYPALLVSIAEDDTIQLRLREHAVEILSFRKPKLAGPVLKKLAKIGSEFALAILQCIQESGWFNPYG